MPIYEYQCEECDHEFEREQRITDPPVKTCPSCRSRRVKKLISQSSFVLKGGGWYNDLYSSSKADGKEDKPDKSDASADKKKESKKDADKGPGKGSGKGSGKPSSKSAA